ncbi:MAG: hypothetical protein RL291_977 [Pseudomonadota bacterium]
MLAFSCHGLDAGELLAALGACAARDLAAVGCLRLGTGNAVFLGHGSAAYGCERGHGHGDPCNADVI